MNTQEVLDAIDREWARLTGTIDALREGASTVPVTEEGWTAKDVVGHCIHWAGLAAFGLGAQVEPPGYVIEQRRNPDAAKKLDGEAWNALAVAYYRDRSLAEVRAEMELLVTKIIDQARSRSDEEMNADAAVPWAGPQPLWQFIGGETFLHWPQHSEAIEHAAAGRS